MISKTLFVILTVPPMAYGQRVWLGPNFHRPMVPILDGGVLQIERPSDRWISVDACLFAVVSRTWRLEPPKAGSHYSTSGSAGTSGSTRRSRNLQARHSRLAPKLGRFEIHGKAPLQHDKLFCHNSGWRNHQQRVLNWFLQGKRCVHIVLYTDCIYMIPLCSLLYPPTTAQCDDPPTSQFCSVLAAIWTKTNVFALFWHRTFENYMICSPLMLGLVVKPHLTYLFWHICLPLSSYM